MEKPLVSIWCITYNHAPYIRECLEGFLMQKTNFPFEVLIHDDASTDGTTEIIRDYEAKYPDIIKPIYETENQYSKGVRGIFAKYCYPRAQGKYIAICEGDDFWCDSHKLQLQFDFMESHPDYSLCGCRDWHLNEFRKYLQHPRNVPPWDQKYPGMESQAFLWDRPFSTGSFFFRHQTYQKVSALIDRDTLNMPFGDVQLMYHLAQQGKTFCLPDRMIVYRIHSNSAMNYANTRRQYTILNMFTAHIRFAIHNDQEEYIPKIIQHFLPVLFPPKSFFRSIKAFLYNQFCKISSARKNYNLYKKHGICDLWRK